MIRDHKDPTPKDTMIHLFELADIRPQNGWEEGGDDSAYITLP